jgi:hypothetical protein
MTSAGSGPHIVSTDAPPSDSSVSEPVLEPACVSATLQEGAVAVLILWLLGISLERSIPTVCQSEYFIWSKASAAFSTARAAEASVSVSPRVTIDPCVEPGVMAVLLFDVI